jgi:hypothetical protein
MESGLENQAVIPLYQPDPVLNLLLAGEMVISNGNEFLRMPGSKSKIGLLKFGK